MKTTIFGKIVEADGSALGRLEIEDGVVTALVRDPHPIGDYIYDPSRYLIFPGFVDIHTHCREDASGDEVYKEHYVTAGLAALSGGVTFIADMPNNPIAPITRASWEKKQHLARVRCPIDVLCYGGIGPDTGEFGADVPYKAYMGPSIGPLFFKDYATLGKTLNSYRARSVSFHCEDPVLLDAYAEAAFHEERRPSVCEWSAIDVALDFIDDYNLDGKICHVSTHRGLEMIHNRQKSGTCVAMEVTPHHLFFDTEMLTAENRRFLQMNPPIRSRADRLALLNAVRDGWFDYLATDHAPHTAQEKLRGISGVPQLDTYGSFVTWLLSEGKVEPYTIWRICCANPGAWVGKFTGRKVGRLIPGYDGSVTVLALSKDPIDRRPLFSKCSWSPFDLRQLPGAVEAVFLRGQKVVDGLYMDDFHSEPLDRSEARKV
jgi:dihydroorotase